MKTFKKKTFFIIVICFLPVFLFFNTFHNFFVSDDFYLIERNWVKSPKDFLRSFTKIFMPPFECNKNLMPAFYRPINELSFAICSFLFKLNPFGYRIFNFLFFISSSIIIFLLVSFYLTKGNSNLGFLASLLFIFHPIHTDPLMWISSRCIVICTFFYLAAFILYLHYKKTKKIKHLITANILFLISLLSKEDGATFPILILLYEAIYNKEIKKSFSFFIILIVYLFFRIFVINLGLGYSFGRYLLFLPDSVYTFLMNIKMLIIPVRIGIGIHLINSPFFTHIGFGIIIGIIIFLIFKYLKNYDFWFNSSFLLLTFLPTITKGYTERWLYLSSVPFAILVSFIFIKILTYSKKIIPYIIIFIFCYLTFYTIILIEKNKVWNRSSQISFNFMQVIKKDLKENPNTKEIVYINIPFGILDIKSFTLAVIGYEMPKISQISSQFFSGKSGLSFKRVIVTRYRNKESYNCSIKLINNNSLILQTNEPIIAPYQPVENMIIKQDFYTLTCLNKTQNFIIFKIDFKETKNIIFYTFKNNSLCRVYL